MFESLSDRLSSVFRKISGRTVLTEDNIKDGLKELRLALLEADVNFGVVKSFIDRIQTQCMGMKIDAALSPTQQIIKVVNDELVALLGGDSTELNLRGQVPSVIMLCGLQGSGKTTTAAKIALHLKKRKMKPYMVPADVYRPAAIEQLVALSKQIDVPYYQSDISMRPEILTPDALRIAKESGADVVIIDTAGRLQIDSELMEELSKIKTAVNPSEILFVADAMTGQDAVNVAKSFHEKLALTGVVLTKMDGDARGGVALSIKSVIGVGVKFVGIGEKINEIEPFYPDRIASRILGMGDVLTLIEKTQENFAEEEAQRTARKLRNNSFDYEDFRSNIRKMRKMGHFSSLVKLIPGMSSLMSAIKPDDEQTAKDLIKTESIINSMTDEERHNPDLIDSSRRARIAAGSGRTISDVKLLQNQFETMRKMMRNIMKNVGSINRSEQSTQMPMDSAFNNSLGGSLGGFEKFASGLGMGTGGFSSPFAGMRNPFAGINPFSGGIMNSGNSSTKKKRDVAKERAKNKKNKKK